jgi:hypothetical protein
MKIYIAGSSNELDIVKPWIEGCKSIGLEITFDWTTAIQSEGANPQDEDSRQHWAIQDLMAVEQADIFWLIVPSKNTGRGCWVEYGYARAMALGRELITIASGDVKVSIFTAVADYTFPAHQQAFEFIYKYIEMKKTPG